MRHLGFFQRKKRDHLKDSHNTALMRRGKEGIRGAYSGKNSKTAVRKESKRTERRKRKRGTLI